MRSGILASWVVGFALTAGLVSVHCGGDDTSGGTGAAGSGGNGGTTVATTTTGGGAGKGGNTSAGGNAGLGGTAGTAGTAGTGGMAGTGGKAGAAGSAGTAGAAGTGGAGGAAGGDGGKPDSGTDARQDTAPDTARPDASDASPDRSTDGSSDAPVQVQFSAVTAIFNQNCMGCHRPRDAGPQLLDLVTPAGLYTRLTTPLDPAMEGACGFGDAGTDGGDAATPSNRQPIVPGDPGASFLYSKVTGTQPAGCGARMPRRNVTGDDGGPAGSVGCNQADGGAAANCLSQADLDTILHWIEQGAHEFPPEN
jgi:hypothetical protein